MASMSNVTSIARTIRSITRRSAAAPVSPLPPVARLVDSADPVTIAAPTAASQRSAA